MSFTHVKHVKGLEPPNTPAPFTSTTLVASAERPAATFSAMQVRFWKVPGLEEVHSSSVSWIERWVPRGNPPLNSHLTVQSMFILQLTTQVNILNLPG